MMISVCILAGGLAKRLRPVTDSIPKSLIEINGKPFISYQIELLKRKGVEHIVISAGFLGEKIKSFVDEKDNFELDIRYSFEVNKLLGTGGAVKNALNKLSNPFFVMYGDSYLDVNLKLISNFFLRNSKMGLMTVYKNQGMWDSSNVIFRKGEIVEYDKKSRDKKMDYIDYGLGILKHEAFEDFSNKDEFDLADLYKNLLSKNELLGYEVTERFYEIGSFEGIKETSEYLLKSQNNYR